MITNKKILLGAGLVAALTVGGFFTYLAKAETNDPPAARHEHGRFLHRFATLGLSADQRASVKAILRKHQPEIKPLVDQLVTERRALRDTVRAATVDEPAIRAQSAKVAAMEADLAVKRAAVAHEIRAVLTPDQIEKLKTIQADGDKRLDGFRARVAKRIAGE